MKTDAQAGRSLTAQQAVDRIQDFSRFVSTYSGDACRSYDEEFHQRLNEIDSLAHAAEDEIKQLRQLCLSLTEDEFSRSQIINHGRSKPFGYSRRLSDHRLDLHEVCRVAE